MTDFTKILGDGMVGLRVCRAEAPLRRRVFLHRSVFCVGLLPGALVQRQRIEDVSIAPQRGTLRVVVLESAQEWERFLGLCREQGPPLQRFVCVYSQHECMLLVRSACPGLGDAAPLKASSSWDRRPAEVGPCVPYAWARRLVGYRAYSVPHRSASPALRRMGSSTRVIGSCCLTSVHW